MGKNAAKWAQEQVDHSPNASVSNVLREQVIREYLSSEGGRQRLADAMSSPIHQRMDHTAVGRRAFLVEQLPDGALPVYDRDIDVQFTDWWRRRLSNMLRTA